MNITVLNYYDGSVWQLTIHSDELNTSDDKDLSECVEEWLVENGFNLNSIEWMQTLKEEIFTNEDL